MSALLAITLLLMTTLPGPGLALVPPSPPIATIRNMRPALQDCELIYRSANLDGVSEEDAKSLLAWLGTDGCVIDLRNDDERADAAEMSEGGRLFYDNIQDVRPRPLLFSDRFWVAIADELDPIDRMIANAKGFFLGSEYDKVLSKRFEKGGLAMLYKVILNTAPSEIGRVLEEITAQVANDRRVLFHCAKGKDRTGIIAALLQLVLGMPDHVVIGEYAMSESLLEEVGNGDRGNSLVDWRKFRGSPPGAMQDTLRYMRNGPGLDPYLDSCGFGVGPRSRLQAALARGPVGQEGIQPPPTAPR